jgi:hypothetical protein
VESKQKAQVFSPASGSVIGSGPGRLKLAPDIAIGEDSQEVFSIHHLAGAADAFQKMRT